VQPTRPWTKPDDIAIGAISSSLGSQHPGGANVMFVDGSVKFLKSTINPAILKALATRNGGEVVNAAAF